MGVKNSARAGTLVLDSEPNDKQKVARRVARGKEVRSALLLVLLGCGGGVLYRLECGRGVALLGGCGGGRRGKKMRKFPSLLYSKPPIAAVCAPRWRLWFRFFFFSKSHSRP